jgi:hypothetical protein
VSPIATAIAAELKRNRPHSVVVLDGDDEEIPISVPLKGHRWERVAETIDGLAWTEIRQLDASGAIMAPPIRQQEPDAAAPVSEHPIPDTPEGRTVHLVLRGIDEALAHHRRVLDPILQGYTRTIETLAERNAQLESSAMRALQLASDAVEANALARAKAEMAETDGTAEGLIGQLIRAAGPELVKRYIGGRVDPELPTGSPS